ncbi:MAG TPA: hypothetical protein PKA88_14245 [Polyangiaceae bacterium]|nr:hypothetical protein [Polyangiaceae bacterium]
MSTCKRTIRVALLAIGVTLLAGSVAASPSYPTEILDALEMDCAAPCTVCHQDTTGGAGTATKAFADALIDNGLEGEAASTVKTALDALDAAGTDSDGDGVGDVEELRQGRDPNLAGDAAICGPQYGCGARIANPNARLDPDATLLALCVASVLLLGSRRRRRTRR